MKYKVKELAEVLHGTVEGDDQTVITSFARIENGKSGAICFYANPKYESYVYESKADAIIVNKDFVPAKPVSPVLIRVDDAYTAIAELLSFVTAQKRSFRRYRGACARWFSSTVFGKKVYLGDFSYVGRHTSIGDYTRICEHVTVGDNVKIGSRCIIYPGVRIYPGTVIGDNVILQANVVIGSDGFGFAPQEDGTYKKIEHTGNVIIEDDVEIGANSTVDKSQMESTVIHKGVKIDNLCQIAHNVEVGRNTVICAQSGIAGSTKVGEHCILAGQSGVVGHATIADNTVVGAKAGVISSVKEPGQALFGTPAIPHKEYMRSFVMFRRAGKEGVKSK